MTAERITIRMELELMPRHREPRRAFWSAPSEVRTRNIPMTERTVPRPAITMGAITAFIWNPVVANAVAPSAAVASTAPQ